MKTGKGNFLTAHYDWLVLGVGIAALVAAGAFYAMAIGEDPEEAANRAAQAVQRRKPDSCGVAKADLSAFETATRLTRSPALLSEVSEKQESFLASEKRVKCKCGQVLLGDVKAMPKCPSCGAAQETEKVVVLDADGDGMPDEWEKKYGLNPADPVDASLDKDGDDFTNLEEFQAKTDPTDAKDHPEYLDSLKVQLPLKETFLPFVFRKATPVPGGWRCEFFDPKKRDAKRGSTGLFTAKIGEKLADTGYVVKNYEKKSAKEAIKGGKGMTKSIDVSEATLERARDGKLVKLVAQTGKTVKFDAVDVQATLVYERNGVKSFEVVPGSEIEISRVKFRVVSVAAVGKGAEVVLENALSAKRTTLKALE